LQEDASLPWAGEMSLKIREEVKETMKIINDTPEITTKEDLMNELRDQVKLRDQMGGSLYWNIMNDECCSLATKCANLGCDRAEIGNILGKGNFR